MINNVFLKPVCILPLPMQKFTLETSLLITAILSIVLLGFVIGFVVKKYVEKKWNYSSILNLLLPVVASVILFATNGISMTFLKGIIFFTLLIVASNSDIHKREVINWIPFSIAILGLIEINLNELPLMLLAVILATLPQLIVAMIKDNSYGGADIKIMAACAFVLGLEGAISAMIIGLTAGVITTVITNKINNKKQSGKFPVIPYLSFGSFLLFIII